MPQTPLKKIERATQMFCQREGFILRTPDAMTADAAFEELDYAFPADFIAAARLVIARLELKAAHYRDWITELEKL